MTKVIAGMAMSLDGFINDRNGSIEELYSDFSALHDAPAFKELIESTGAVIMGRHVYDMADPFTWVNDDYEFQVPLFILTHNPPEKFPKGNDKLTVTFVTDGVENAITQARKAAGDKIVQVIGGANTVQQCLNSGLCNELLIDIMPVLLGSGLRLFENIDTDAFKLERTKVEETTPMRTTIAFRVTKRIR